MGEGEKSQEMALYIDGQPVEPLSDAPEITITPNREQGQGLQLAESITGFAEAAKAMSEAFGTTFRQVAKTFAKFCTAMAEAAILARAIPWAEIHRPRLAHIYRHAKKGRVRKKCRRRIITEYRKGA